MWVISGPAIEVLLDTFTITFLTSPLPPLPIGCKYNSNWPTLEKSEDVKDNVPFAGNSLVVFPNV